MAYSSVPTQPGLRLPAMSGRQMATQGSAVLIGLYIVLLFIPLDIHLGPIRLSPYRIFLLLMVLPATLQWISGRLGRIMLPDLLFLFFVGWTALALTVHHGLGSTLQGNGMLFIECFGSYVIARKLIQNEADFLFFVKFFAASLAVAGLLAAYESLTFHRIILRVFEGHGIRLGTSQTETRFGMLRAQGSFESPILLGVFASAGLSMAFYTFKAQSGFIRGVIGSLGPAMTCFFSLSMGAWLSGFFQVLLVGYDMISRRIAGRWRLLVIGIVGAYIFVDIAATRGPVAILLNTLAYNAQAAWMRVVVWDHGSAAVMNSPLIGVGFNTFPAPSWVTESVDNFWLVWALRGGLPSALAMLLGAIMVIVTVARARYAEPRFNEYRLGILISLAGVCLAIASVHLWNASFSFLMFVFGAAMWLADGEKVSPESAANAESNDPREAVDGRPPSPYGRQPLAGWR